MILSTGHPFPMWTMWGQSRECDLHTYNVKHAQKSEPCGQFWALSMLVKIVIRMRTIVCGFMERMWVCHCISDVTSQARMENFHKGFGNRRSDLHNSFVMA